LRPVAVPLMTGANGIFGGLSPLLMMRNSPSFFLGLEEDNFGMVTKEGVVSPPRLTQPDR
jgi:hypothetical protein